MDRLFLDANVLFSAAYRADAGVTRLWSDDRWTLVTSEHAIDEARRNLDHREQPARLEELLSVSLPVDLRGEVQLREKDWPILGAAINANATHLITGDRRGFGAYFGTELFAILVLLPGDYLRQAADSAT